MCKLSGGGEAIAKNRHTSRSLCRIAAVCMALALCFGFVPVTSTATAHAANGAAGFDHEHIMSDSLFYDGAAMTSQQVQEFLNSKVTRCEIGSAGKRPGDVKPGSGPEQRYASACLNGYRQDTPRIAADSFCGAYAGTTRETAAQMIAKVGKACGISQKVLIVMLQKEQSLITSTAPTTRQYDRAMGYRCPDAGENFSAVCDSGQAGLFRQIYGAARQFKVYLERPASFRHKVGQYNTVAWHPNPACGTSRFVIRNNATAALYNYTPYRPNDAALQAGSGTGDHCSTYGHRNFYLRYRGWFGPTTIQRIDGADRYATAANVAQHSFPSAVKTVVVATGQDFPDALSAAPLAAKMNAPLLLTQTNRVTAETRAQLSRLRPQRIIVVGGTGVVSPGVEDTLRGYAPVTRLAGADRYATSLEVAKHGWSTTSAAFVATGADYADALSAAPAAALRGGPVLLIPNSPGVHLNRVNSQLARLGAKDIYVSGGEGVISSVVVDTLGGRASVTRYGGADRYATSALIVDATFSPATTAETYWATGADYADALTGAAAAGARKGALLLSHPACVPAMTLQSNVRLQPERTLLLGGTGALSETVLLGRGC